MSTCLDCKYWRHWLDYGRNAGCTDKVLPGDDEPGECIWGDELQLPISWQYARGEITGVNSDQDASDCMCFDPK